MMTIPIKGTSINLDNVNYITKQAPFKGETAERRYWKIFIKFRGGGDLSFNYDNEEDLNADLLKLQ